MAKSPQKNAGGSEILRYDLGWKAINELLRSGRSLSGHERNCAFLNLGAAKVNRFADVSSAISGDLDDDGRVLALSDWDHDGDPDLWIANRSGPQIRYLRNDIASTAAYIALRLRGTTCNRDAIGARVTVTSSTGQQQTQTLSAGEGYLAQSSKTLHFGLGAATGIRDITVRWPGGEEEKFTTSAMNCTLELTEGHPQAKKRQAPQFAELKPSPLKEPANSAGSRLILLQPMPLPDLAGTTQGIGHARLINLWAHWCKPCIEELKGWSNHVPAFEQAGLEILALNVDQIEDHSKWEAMNLPFRYQYGDQKLVEQFDVLQRALLSRQRPLPLPTSFLIDGRGCLRAIYRGPVEAEQLLNDVALIGKDRAETLAAATPLAGRWHRPPGGSTPTRLAIQFIEGGYSDQAEAYIRSLSEDPQYQSANLLNILGALLVDRREFKQAAATFERVLSIAPDDRKAHIELGGLLLGIKKGAEAQAHFEAALRSDPNDPELILKIGIAQHQQGMLEDAKGSLERALSLQSSAIGYWSLGRVEQALSEPTTAIRAFEQAIAMDNRLVAPEQNQHLSEIAAAYAEAGRHQDAVATLGRASHPSVAMQQKLEQYRQQKP